MRISDLMRTFARENKRVEGMNFEEMLIAHENQNPTYEKTPLGSFSRRQVDGKYRYFIELRGALTDSIVFCEALKSEQQWSLQHRSKHQLRYELRYDGSNLKEIELEYGNFITLASLLDQNPAIVAKKGFVDEMVNSLFDYASSLHSMNVFHLCFAPNFVFLRKNENTPLLLCHGSFYKAMSDQPTLYANVEEYVAPEVLLGQDADERSDVYSLGRLIAFLFSQGDVPYEYRHVVKKATSGNPDNRYKSIDDMRNAIAKKRYMRRSLIYLAVAVAISLLSVYLYMDSLNVATADIEFVEPVQQAGLISSEELEDNALVVDSLDVTDEALLQKAEMIYRKRYQAAANEILSKVYNSKHMGASEKTFMANTHSMAEELLKVQQELAEEAGIPESLAGKIGHEIVEKLTEEKQKGLTHNGYIKSNQEEE